MAEKLREWSIWFAIALIGLLGLLSIWGNDMQVWLSGEQPEIEAPRAEVPGVDSTSF